MGASTASLAPDLLEQQKLPVKTQFDSEVLLGRNEIKIDRHRHRHSRTYYSVKLNSLTAVQRYSRIRIPYNAHREIVELEFARTLAPNGNLSILDESATRSLTLDNPPPLNPSATAALEFWLPDLQVGSILEFQFYTNRSELPSGTLASTSVWAHWQQYSELDGYWHADPVRNFVGQLELTQPDTESQIVLPINVKQPKRSAGKTTKNIYHWQVQDIPALELPTPRTSIVKGIYLASVDDLQEAGETLVKPIEKRLRGAQAINLPSAPSESATGRLHGVYKSIQSRLRWIQPGPEVGLANNASVDQIWQQGYGDSLDHALVTTALLREHGFAAYVAVLPVAVTGLPTKTAFDHFGHALVWLPAQADIPETWLDTTGLGRQFPGVDRGLRGHTALILDSASGPRLSDVNLAERDRAKLAVAYRINPTAELEATVTLQLKGGLEQTLRSWRPATQDPRKLFDTLFSNMPYQISQLRMIDQQHPIRPAKLQAQIQFNPTDPIEVEVSAAQLADFMAHLGYAAAYPSSEASPPTTLLMDVEIHPAPEQYASVLTSAPSLVSAGMEVQQKGERIANGYQIRIKLVNPASQADTLEKAATTRKSLAPAGRWVVAISTPPATVAQQTLAELVNAPEIDTLEGQLTLTRFWLDQGQWDRAFALAEALVERYPTSGEAWFLFGTAQGMELKFEAAQSAFERASELGYSGAPQ